MTARVALFLTFAAAGLAADAARPAWLTELSATARAGYDSNLYFTDVARPGEALDRHDALVTALGAKMTVSVSALAGAAPDRLVVGYAPTRQWHRGASLENNTQQRLTVQSAGKSGDWSWSLDSASLWVDGADTSPHFRAYHLFGMGFVRDRRDQLQETARAWLRVDRAGGFVRATGSLVLCDFHTQLRAPTGADAGWLNWIDRRDLNGGFDAGWKVSPSATLVAGARVGEQVQGACLWTPKSSTNRYTRLLLGLEGKTGGGRLSYAFLAGPDFRRYDASSQYIVDRTPTAAWGEASLTATLTKADALTASAKRERWLSSTGQAVYDGDNLQLGWRHRFSPAWSTQLSGQYQRGKYVAPTVRDDELRTASGQVQWTVSSRLALTLDVAWQAGVDRLRTAATAGRDFHRVATGLGARWAY